MIIPKNLTIKQFLAQLTSKQGLIAGSVIGLIALIVSVYLLVPIFEKSEENAIDIVKTTVTLNKTTQKFEQTSEQLKQTSNELDINKQKVAALKTVEGELIAAQERIVELKTVTQKDGTTIAGLQDKIADKNSNISSLKAKTQSLNNNISEKKRKLNERKEWIGELKKHDDEIVENAMLLVDNFMKISDTSDTYGMSSSKSRNELLVDTLTLVNTLDTQRNNRKMFVEDIDVKLNKDE
jgi:chromosome segregation ATPase